MSNLSGLGAMGSSNDAAGTGTYQGQYGNSISTGFLGMGGTANAEVYGPGYNANQYNQGAVQQGQGLYGQQAPQINMAAGNAYGAGLGSAIQNQESAANLAQQTAMGKGAAIDASNQAVQQQFGQNLGQQLNASAALANSGRGGGPGLAAAQGQAGSNLALQSSQSAQSAGIAAAQARAGLMSQANQQYGSIYGNIGNQYLQAQQQQYGVAGEQAKLQGQQNALGQQGLLSSEQLGQGALLAQQQANSNAFANQLGLAGTAQQTGGAVAGAGVSALGALGAAVA
jgi:hypothetical protein